MTDKSVFTDEEWHAVTDAPLLITAAIFAVGEHGPISITSPKPALSRDVEPVADTTVGQGHPAASPS